MGFWYLVIDSFGVHTKLPKYIKIATLTAFMLNWYPLVVVGCPTRWSLYLPLLALCGPKSHLSCFRIIFHIFSLFFEVRQQIFDRIISCPPPPLPFPHYQYCHRGEAACREKWKLARPSYQIHLNKLLPPDPNSWNSLANLTKKHFASSRSQHWHVDAISSKTCSFHQPKILPLSITLYSLTIWTSFLFNWKGFPAAQYQATLHYWLITLFLYFVVFSFKEIFVKFLL